MPVTPALLNIMSRRPKRVGRGGDRGRDVGFDGHVAVLGDRHAAGLGDQTHGLGGPVVLHVGDEDVRALLGEPQRRRPARPPTPRR